MNSNQQSLILIVRSLLFNLNCLLLLLRSLLFSPSRQLLQLLLLVLLPTQPHLRSQCPPTVHHFLTTQAGPIPIMVPGPLNTLMAVSSISSFLEVPQCPKGTRYQDRISSDHSSVLRVLESASSTI